MSIPPADDTAGEPPVPPGYRDLLTVFGRIGLLSFGGPAAQIALMHGELVERRRWLDAQSYLGALGFCMLLPGPEAMQLATYTGWKLRGVPGGLLAGILFILPGALVILGLGLGYAHAGQLPLVQTLFTGIKATVVVILARALWALARRALTGPGHRVLALLAFAALYVANLPFPLIIAAAALWGGIGGGRGQALPVPPPAPHPAGPLATLRTVAIWLGVWLVPVAALALSGAGFLTDLALFFSKLAVAGFGGAYAVLTYVAQAAVDTKGWLDTGQMMDALGLAETTPGPLILVTEFVGLLAGYGRGGTGLALAGAAVTLWVTFVPCFLWIFAGAPYVDRILAQPRLRGALQAVTAAVAGVILNLAVLFTLHTLFGTLTRTPWGVLPQPAGFQPAHALLIGIAAFLLTGLRLPLIACLPLMAALSAAFAAITGT